MTNFFSLKAPAKINWFLYITSKRKDGYHDIYSIMQCVSLFDNIYFEPSDNLEIITNANIPVKENLVYKAAIAVRRYTGVKNGVRITLKKSIPIGAGLGGGSSDAGYTIRGLNQLWSLNLSKRDFLKISKEIGSDVPFFMNGNIALVKGRGEKIKELKLNKEFLLLLIKPDINISTSWAYKRFDIINKGKRLTKVNFDIKLFLRALEEEDFNFLDDLIYNDFIKVVFGEYPILSKLKEEMVKTGALLTGLSGSGPTLFGLYKNEDDALKALRCIKPFWGTIVKTLI